MSSSESHDGDEIPSPPRAYLVRGIVAGIICDALISLPLAMLLPLVRPEHVGDAVSKLLFGLNMLVGYVGGRVAARAGISHEDSRSQWTMASVVSGASIVTAELIERLRIALHLVHAQPVAAQQSTEHASIAPLLFWLTSMLLLIRFGYAMGTYAQAKRDGRVQDEDEANAE